MLHIEKSSNSKSSKYGSQSTEVRILKRAAGRSWQCGPVLNPQEDVFSIKISPMDSEDYMLSQKLLIYVRMTHLPWKPAIGSLSTQDLPLIVLGSLLSCLRCSVRSTMSSRSFFILKTKLLLSVKPVSMATEASPTPLPVYVMA